MYEGRYLADSSISLHWLYSPASHREDQYLTLQIRSLCEIYKEGVYTQPPSYRWKEMRSHEEVKNELSSLSDYTKMVMKGLALEDFK